jgi:hypothetical protein
MSHTSESEPLISTEVWSDKLDAVYKSWQQLSRKLYERENDGMRRFDSHVRAVTMPDGDNVDTW